MTAARAIESPLPRWNLFVWPAVLTTILLFLAPMVVFLANSVYPIVTVTPAEPGPTLSYYINILTDPFYWRAFWRTGELALYVVAGALLLGFPLAYVLARTRSRWRGALTSLVVMSLFVSVVIRALGWKLILGPSGPVNTLLRDADVISKPLPLSDNFLGTAIAMIHAELPFMVLMLIPVIQLVPRSLEDAALSLGSSWPRVFRRVVLPLTLPGLVSGSLLVASLSMGAFTTPALLSGGREPFLSLLIEQQVILILDYPKGAALATLLIALVLLINAVVLVALQRRLTQRRS